MRKEPSLFVQDKGIARRFIYMLRKAKIPYVWIACYIAISALLTNIGLDVTEYTSKLFAGDVNFTAVILPFLFYQLLSLVIGSISGIVSDLCSARINRNFRSMIWQKIVKLPMSFYETNEPKELISRITTDVTVISRLIMQVFVAIITSLYSVFVTLQRIGSYDNKLMLSLIVILPFNILIAFFVGKIQFGISDKVNRKNAELTQSIAERTNNAMLIKSFTNEDKEYQNGKTKMKELYTASIANSWVSSLTSPMYVLAGMMQFIVIVLVGRGFYADGSLSLQEWIAYFGFATAIVNVLTSYCGYWTTLKSSQGATNRISHIMQKLDEPLHKGEAAENLKGDISIDNIVFYYGEKLVLDHFSARLPKGKTTAIIGPSGSGKTTLLNLIERFYPWKEGQITIGEKDIQSYSLKSYRDSIAYVTQESVLLSGTIKDNLLYGIHRSVTQEELESACKAAFIHDFILSLPQKYDTKIGENGSTLSGGQKQRLSLARAFLKKANYLLMDEATAAMDITTKEGIWDSIRENMKEKTVVFVAHDQQTVRQADYIVIMAEGKVLDCGTQQQMKDTSSYYQEILNERGRE
ncbi:ABC transporter ATP-binding protein [Scatolibacter rhodanostii]|uniref:ABC transporter ATP-binding protein n=1 Tax=Scatolibacter rhodanostii TaxID=2014781 RepID=UPI001356718C|nr:ABC transporter ATP-binding protein [Scatolibacter rhodanostii]